MTTYRIPCGTIIKTEPAYDCPASHYNFTCSDSPCDPKRRTPKKSDHLIYNDSASLANQTFSQESSRQETDARVVYINGDEESLACSSESLGGTDDSHAASLDLVTDPVDDLEVSTVDLTEATDDAMKATVACYSAEEMDILLTGTPLISGSSSDDEAQPQPGGTESSPDTDNDRSIQSCENPMADADAAPHEEGGAHPPAVTQIDFASKTVIELRKICKQRGIDHSGRKSVLVSRLCEDFTASSQTPCSP